MDCTSSASSKAPAFSSSHLLILSLSKKPWQATRVVWRYFTISCGLALAGMPVLPVIFTAEDSYCLSDKHVLVVDDVVESGNSLKYVRNWLGKFEPKSIRTAALVQVRIKGKMPVVDSTGFTAPMEWFVGFGIDFNDRFRDTPHFCALADTGKKEFAA